MNPNISYHGIEFDNYLIDLTSYQRGFFTSVYSVMNDYGMLLKVTPLSLSLLFSHLFLPVWLAAKVRPFKKAAEFAFISPGEGDQGILRNLQPEERNVYFTTHTTTNSFPDRDSTQRALLLTDVFPTVRFLSFSMDSHRGVIIYIHTCCVCVFSGKHKEEENVQTAIKCMSKSPFGLNLFEGTYT